MTFGDNENLNQAHINLPILELALGDVELSGIEGGGIFGSGAEQIRYDVAVQGFCEDLISGTYKEKDGDSTKTQTEILINHGTDNSGTIVTENTVEAGDKYQIVDVGSAVDLNSAWKDISIDSSLTAAVGEVFTAKLGTFPTGGKVMNISSVKGIAITELTVGNFYEITNLGTYDSDWSLLGGPDNAKLDMIFKCSANGTGDSLGAEVKDISYNKGGFFIMENPIAYLYNDESGDFHRPELTDWSAAAKTATDGTSGGWGAYWSRSGVNFDGSGFGNVHKGSKDEAGNVLSSSEGTSSGLGDSASGARPVANDAAKIIRFTSYEGAQNVYNSDGDRYGNQNLKLTNLEKDKNYYVTSVGDGSKDWSSLRSDSDTADVSVGTTFTATSTEVSDININGINNASVAKVFISEVDGGVTKYHCNTKVLKVGKEVSCDGTGDSTTDGSYKTYESTHTSDLINNSKANTPLELTSDPDYNQSSYINLHAPSGSNFIGCRSAFPAVNYGPNRSDLENEYKDLSGDLRNLFSERFIADNQIEKLRRRDIATYKLESEYNPGVLYQPTTLDASLKKGTTSIADACLLAISIALTKQAYGNEIVVNDPSLRAKIRAQVRAHINKMFGYTDRNDTGLHGLSDGGILAYKIDTDSISDNNAGGDVISQYINNSGRTSQGATAEAQNLDMDNMDITFLITLTGNVKDKDKSPSDPKPPSSEVIKAVFGTSTDHQTKVIAENVVNPPQSVGDFSINVFVSLKNIKTVDFGNSLYASDNTAQITSTIASGELGNSPIGGALASDGNGV